MTTLDFPKEDAPEWATHIMCYGSAHYWESSTHYQEAYQNGRVGLRFPHTDTTKDITSSWPRMELPPISLENE